MFFSHSTRDPDPPYFGHMWILKLNLWIPIPDSYVGFEIPFVITFEKMLKKEFKPTLWLIAA